MHSSKKHSLLNASGEREREREIRTCLCVTCVCVLCVMGGLGWDKCKLQKLS